MPWIHFAKKNHVSFEVPIGTELMQALLDQKIPVASSCNGDGVCAKCRLHIVKGMPNLSTADDNEKFLIQKNKIAANHRISCQTQVLGDITIDAGYW